LIHFGQKRSARDPDFDVFGVQRLDEKQRAALLRIVAKRDIVRANGGIVDYELHSPFAYLQIPADGLQKTAQHKCGSDQAWSGPPA
jgi:hypothetical protein